MIRRVYTGALMGLLIATASAQSVRVPLKAGLTIVTALNQPEHGDYESIKVITRLNEKAVSLTYSAEAPGADAGPQHVNATRTVSREDMKAARAYRWMFNNGAPESYPGSTALGVSAAVLADLKSKGQAELSVSDTRVGGALGGLLGGILGKTSIGTIDLTSGTLKRIEAGTVPFKALLNDTSVELRAIHARGRLGDDETEFLILDEPENPLALKWTIGGSRLQVIRLSYPADTVPTTASAPPARIERELATQGRTVVYGIYFDFASDRIRDESQPVLKEIADAMMRNPSWTLNVEGHTDNIGGPAANLELSRRRANAVRQALATQYHIASTRLLTSGYGAQRPKDTNDTLDGRARNRRVELVRQ